MGKMQYYTVKDYVEILEENGLLLEDGAKEAGAQVIRTMTYNSKEAEADTLFICKGAAFKPMYLREAVERGAVCYVSEKMFAPGESVPYILVKDIRKAMSVLANFFYNKPWKIWS